MPLMMMNDDNDVDCDKADVLYSLHDILLVCWQLADLWNTAFAAIVVCVYRRHCTAMVSKTVMMGPMR